MDRSHMPMLRLSTAALVLSGYWALTAVPGTTVLIMVPPMIAILCMRGAEYLHTNFPAYGIATRALTIAYLCFLPMTVLSMDILPAVMLLVGYIQFYTLLHVKEVRNYYHLQLMSLFLLLAACVQMPEPIIAVIMLTFLISGVWATLSLRLVAEEVRAANCVTPEIVGIDDLNRHAFHGTVGTRRGNLPLTAVALSVLAVTTTVFLFMLTPRIEAGMFGRSQQVVETTGLTEEVDLTSGSTILEDTTPVMMVRFPEERGGLVRSEDWLYWRVSTLGRYTGNSWDRQVGEFFDPGILHSGSYITETSLNTDHTESELARSAREGYQVIYLDVIPEKGIPAMQLPQRMAITEQTRGKRLRWGNDGDLTILLDRSPNVRRLNYEVWSEPGKPSIDALRSAPDFDSEPDDVRSRNFLAHNLSQMTVRLTARVVGDADNAYDKADAILKFLSSSEFLYTRNIPDMGSAPVIDTFINRSRLGHCELFATAMALMLRSQGVPTRVVNGYRGGEWDDSAESYTIRANMAHLWVEAWFPGQGWVIFDPSPRGDGDEVSRMKQLELMLSSALLRSKIFWFQEVVGFDRAIQVKRLKDISLGLIRDFSSGDESVNGSTVGLGGYQARRGMSLLYILFVALIVAAVVSYVRRKKASPQQTFSLNADQLQVIRLYVLLRRKLQKYGVDCKGKTAEELKDVVEDGRWEASEMALAVLKCYNIVRFGGAPLRNDELSILRRNLKNFRLRETTG